MNFLIETKQEYTIHLVNSITTLIYDGLANIYEEAKNKAIETSKNNEELKIFQMLLSSVPKWNPNIIDSEYQRIIRLNTLGKTIEELLKAVIKSNIIVLTNINIDYDERLLKDLNIQDDFKNFIHFVYIECARAFYNSPFLFSHRESTLNIKRNQSEILKIIQECIKNAIRKMIPLQVTIKTYLDNKQNKLPCDLQSESKQLMEILKSEKNRRTELTPSSPKQLADVLAATTLMSDDYNTDSSNGGNVNKNNNILKNNNKIIELSEQTLRSSILNIDTENENKNIFILDSGTKNKNNKKNVSESSAYYENSKNNVIEEYSNKNNKKQYMQKELPILKETEVSSENSEKNNKGKNYKYFSHLNV
jgi:hypothetical protein